MRPSSHIRMSNYEKVILHWCEMCTGIQYESVAHIPDKTMEVISSYTYEELCYPILASELKKGKTRRQLARKYSVTEYAVKSAGRRIGAYCHRKKQE